MKIKWIHCLLTQKSFLNIDLYCRTSKIYHQKSFGESKLQLVVQDLCALVGLLLLQEILHVVIKFS